MRGRTGPACLRGAGCRTEPPNSLARGCPQEPRPRSPRSGPASKARVSAAAPGRQRCCPKSLGPQVQTAQGGRRRGQELPRGPGHRAAATVYRKGPAHRAGGTRQGLQSLSESVRACQSVSWRSHLESQPGRAESQPGRGGRGGRLPREMRCYWPPVATVGAPSWSGSCTPSPTAIRGLPPAEPPESSRGLPGYATPDQGAGGGGTV